MGSCFSACCGERPGHGSQSGGNRGKQPLTQRDAEARVKAAEAAEARNQLFEQGAYGKAVRKTQENIKKERENEAERRRNNRADENARDWLS